MLGTDKGSCPTVPSPSGPCSLSPAIKPGGKWAQISPQSSSFIRIEFEHDLTRNLPTIEETAVSIKMKDDSKPNYLRLQFYLGLE
jgi:hypothetical protein